MKRLVSKKIRAMIIKGTGNLNNSYESNYLRMRDEQYEVRPNIGYTLSHNASRDARTSH